MHNTSLYWFTNDLRLDDNLALQAAIANSHHLVCFYCIDPKSFEPCQYHTKPLGGKRWRFIWECLQNLKEKLRFYNQELFIYYADTTDCVSHLVNYYQPTAVYRSVQAGFDENRQWQKFRHNMPEVLWCEAATHTLFSESLLPFGFSAFPSTFSGFRKKTECLKIKPAIWEVSYVPPLPLCPVISLLGDLLPPVDSESPPLFPGGADEGMQRLTCYFESDLPATYKIYRNELDSWENSSNFSPWLATGCISPRQILSALRKYEIYEIANESTYWLYFEMLWREYFHWYALAFGRALFRFSGIKNKKPLTRFCQNDFRRWCEGETAYPIVNACMNQLKKTGFLSNKGRQIAASCLVNEIGVDWRYGAAWFQEQLIDYDVSSNWGNWQYIAGVGPGPGGGRHFDLSRQEQLYDRNGQFVEKWQGGA